jgi:hypothetical protein
MNICKVGVPDGFGTQFRSDGRLWTGTNTVAGVSELLLLYTDTGTAMDSIPGLFHMTWNSHYTCYGDTSGDDICTSSDCTRCTVAFTGCLPVEYCKLSVY